MSVNPPHDLKTGYLKVLRENLWTQDRLEESRFILGSRLMVPKQIPPSTHDSFIVMSGVGRHPPTPTNQRVDPAFPTAKP
jgi:hypothetical protein